jgi:hemerythrin-like domain-containing protein
MPNAITLLKEDHKRVEPLLEELAETGDRAARRREDLLRQLALELVAHATIEEEIFYPAFLESLEKKGDEKLYYEAQEEHLTAKVVLADLQRADPATPSFHGKAKVLNELASHHVEEEEGHMFKLAREVMGKARLEELGAAMAARKQELLAERANGAAPRRSAGARA